MKNGRLRKRLVAMSAFAFVLAVSAGAFGPGASASNASGRMAKSFVITSPYKNVNWDSYGQYKTGLHVHTRNSDGAHTTEQMVENHYEKGYSVLAVTDHNYLTESWDTVNRGPMETKRMREIERGADRDGNGMIAIPLTNEQSHVDHVISFNAEYNSVNTETLEQILETIQKLKGFSHLNHPGRHTGGSVGGEKGAEISNDKAVVKKYVDLFNKYKSCVGMEIINKIDNESRSDRILWDNILAVTMQKGRNVFGFSNDDAHSMNAVGYSFNVLLMPRLSAREARKAMETGAFYAVSRVSRVDGINAKLQNGSETPESGVTNTLYLLEQPTPSISEITVSQNEGTITITGSDYDVIEWIADGKVIATGETLNLYSHQASVNYYVRAQLKNDTGIAFAQPFRIQKKF